MTAETAETVRQDVPGPEVPADGTELPPLTVTLTRSDLVRYAGASEDFNPVHWNPRVAREAGLPDVIAHGMLTMAIAARAVTDWTGDPGAIVEYRTRFSRPVPVPDGPGGALVEVGGRVARWLGDGLVRIDLTVTCGGTKVLSEARAVVRLRSAPAPAPAPAPA
ncbi:MaoC family dehydratase [Streptomyces qinzhouensis]|uniref:MaoC family dehydratase n=1 Tax=Streptomyces qinzhouensis TaxID=2599401 RepID=UPI001FE52D9F|nr:MaoC family dehydratase [Streptomyces qinzhouensis]